MANDAPDAPALFRSLDDGRLLATDLARGPWDARALHGGPVAALAARALEAVLAETPEPTADPPLRPARFVLELERPVGLDPLAVAAEVIRAGRSVRTAQAEITDDAGRRLARATLLAIRERPSPLDLADADQPDDRPPAPPGPATGSTWRSYDDPAFHRDAVSHSFVSGSFEGLGPATDWITLRVPVVAGEDPSPLQRVVAAADFGNGISAAVAHATHTFINPDLVVALARRPVGTAIGVEAVTRVDADGIGLAEATLWDQAGRVGASSQTLVVDRRS